MGDCGNNWQETEMRKLEILNGLGINMAALG